MTRNRSQYAPGARVVPGSHIYPAVKQSAFKLPFYIVNSKKFVVDDLGRTWRAGGPSDSWFVPYLPPRQEPLDE
jgi:hypothetical protein